MIAGQLNRIVTIENWSYTTNLQGNSVGSVAESWNQRANVQDTSGRQFTDDAQQQWRYDIKVTVRVSLSNPVSSNSTLVYEGFRYTINDVSIDSEGHKSFYILRCSKKEIWQGSS